MRGGPISTIALEKVMTLSRIGYEDDILMCLGLNELAMVGHVHHDLPLLMALVERCNLDMNNFHLPPSEMTATLLDIYKIWGIPNWGQLVHQVEIVDNNFHHC